MAAALALVALPAAASSQPAPDRYSLVNGCYTLTSASGTPLADGQSLRMQATTLGRYLLYRPDNRFVASREDGTVGPADEPSPAADWNVEDAGGGSFTLSPVSADGKVLIVGDGGAGSLADKGSAGDAARLRFVPAQGCATYPEAELNATGTPSKGKAPYSPVKGLIEGHMHWMTYLYFGGRFHCGRPWHPYGIAYAMPDCSSIEGPQGTAAPFQNFLNYGNPAQPHDTSGYPKFTEWSKDNLTYEGTYWRWVQRAHMSGLRLMVMGINENRVLCETQQNREYDCNEMNTVRRGLRAMKELQAYVDAQAGGPGKGFFQIVTDPYDARQVINRGQMAVVLEIEISEPFDCRGWDQPSCNQEQVDKQLDEMYDLGVRSMLLLNKFDNPLTGVRFDSGPAGVVINSGNKESSGSFWDAKTCTGPLSDNTIFQPEPNSAQGIASLLGSAGLPTGETAPVYPPAPHCNTRGLTQLGRHVVRRMMDKRMIVNPDHMSQAGVDDTLTLLESRRYSGVISPHGWMDPGNWPRLWKLGGVAFPGHSGADEYVKDWERFRPQKTPYKFGWGYGADLGGLSHQPDPSSNGSISYPFKSFDGKVSFDRQKSGERTFDYAKEGVSHYGLYADWFDDLRRISGGAMVQDMAEGAEAYLQMWERADGIRTPRCTSRSSPLTATGRVNLRLGMDWQALLRRAGQPQQRGTVWTYCTRGSLSAADVAILDSAGKVVMVGSNARGRRAGGVRIGASASRLRGTRSAGAGVRYRLTRRGAWVYAVSGGRVRAVATVSRSFAKRPRALRLAARRVLKAKASAAPRTFVPNPAQAAGKRVTGQPLAGTTNPELNEKLALLCGLQSR